MIKFLKISIFTIIGFALFAVNSNSANAAKVYPVTSSPTVSVGGVFLIDIELNTEGQEINTVEGELVLSSTTPSYKLVDILLGGSELTLWTEKPQIIQSGSTTVLKFTGGSSAGINKSNALLMKLAVEATDSSAIQITPRNLQVFLHDGAGTKKTASAESVSVRIVPAEESDFVQDTLRDLISKDNTPPEPFEIQLGRDASLFDGQWFVSFNATDTESGIAYYEVKEGDRSAVRSGTTYVLQDQDLKSTITVVAYDKAGNSRVMVWEPSGGFWSKLAGKAIVILVVILALIGLWFLFSKIKKLWLKRKQNQNSV